MSSSETSRRRRLAPRVAVVVALAAGLIVAVSLRHLDHEYGPVDPGSFGGPSSSARLLGSLSNDGAHSIRITSIDNTDVVSNVRWSVYRTKPDGVVSGKSTPWRNFPAAVPARDQIRLLIALRRPSDCAQSPEGTRFYDGYHNVHWKSLLHSHVTSVQIYQTETGVPIC